MESFDVRKKYLDFYQARGHHIIPSAKLVPENDPTTLFNSSGMQPLVPYLLGQPHPEGKRLVNSQKSFRAQDIDEVGDNRHTTFFEMLGNWSLGDYFKKEQLPWIFEFLTKELRLDPKRLFVSVFEGTKDVPRDEESVAIWKRLGIPDERIFFYGVEKNWWSRSGEPEKMPPGEPGGPDSEVFYEFTQVKHDPKFGKVCHPNCDCGRFMEIANSVFMQYVKKADGRLAELPNKNVDFGGGLERLTAATKDDPDIFATDFFSNAIKTLEAINKSDQNYMKNPKPFRIIADHLRATIFMVSDGVEPSNKAQGYVLRRLLRKSMVQARKLGMVGDEWLSNALPHLVQPYIHVYQNLNDIPRISETLTQEIDRFRKTIDKGLSEITKIENFDGKVAFFLYESYGFPWEMTEEIAREKGQKVDRKQFEEEFKKHQDLSRTAAKGMFAGGLADQGEQTTKLHTATHLLHQALRTVLGDHVQQKGSNITSERLRFDFSHPEKIPKEGKEGLEGIEKLVNKKIEENLPVSFAVMDKDEALASGALAFFGERYGDKVKVYTIENPSTSSGSPPFSREICGGPHVSFTGTLGHFTIVKEEALGSGVRRIYAQLT